MTELNLWQMQRGVQPPALVPLIGKRVKRAWILPSGKVLFIRLTGDQTLLVEPHEIAEQSSLKIQIGHAQSNMDWDGLDRAMPQTPHLEALQGLAFTGLDGNIVEFGDKGAAITPHGIQWMRVLTVSSA